MTDILSTFEKIVRLENNTRLIAETKDRAKMAAHEQQIADLRATLPLLSDDLMWAFRKFAAHTIDVKRIRDAIAKNEQAIQEEIVKAEEAKKSIARKYTVQRAAKEIAALDDLESVVRIRALNSDLRRQIETAELVNTSLRNIVHSVLQSFDDRQRINEWISFEYKTTMPACIERCLEMRRAEIEPHMIVVGRDVFEPSRDIYDDISLYDGNVKVIDEIVAPLREWPSIKPQIIMQEEAVAPPLVKRDRRMLPGESRSEWMSRTLFPKVVAKKATKQTLTS